MTVISVVERNLPACGRCGAPLRRARSITEGLCCCERNTCHTPEPFGCLVCGAFLIGRNDEVLGCCSRCQVLTHSPAVAVAPRSATAGTNLAGPFYPHQDRSDSPAEARTGEGLACPTAGESASDERSA